VWLDTLNNSECSRIGARTTDSADILPSALKIPDESMVEVFKNFASEVSLAADFTLLEGKVW
jgi:hypothetical protein